MERHKFLKLLKNSQSDKIRFLWEFKIQFGKQILPNIKIHKLCKYFEYYEEWLTGSIHLSEMAVTVLDVDSTFNISVHNENSCIKIYIITVKLYFMIGNGRAYADMLRVFPLVHHTIWGCLLTVYYQNNEETLVHSFTTETWGWATFYRMFSKQNNHPKIIFENTNPSIYPSFWRAHQVHFLDRAVQCNEKIN